MATISQKKQDALDFIIQHKNDEVLVREFFKVANGSEIFDTLINNGFYDIAEIPIPYEAEEGGIVHKPWPAMQYIKKVATESSESKNEKLAEKILKLIADIIEKLDHPRITNSYIWDDFSEILTLVPIDTIYPEIIERVCEGFANVGYNGLMLHHLGITLLGKFLEVQEQSSYENIKVLIGCLLVFDLSGNNKLRHRDKPSFLCEAFWVKDFLNRYTEQLSLVPREYALDIIIEKLDFWIASQDEGNRLTYVYRPAIEEHQQNDSFKLDTSNILIFCVRDISFNLCKAGRIDNKVLVREYWGKTVLYKRLAVYLANYYCPNEITKYPLDKLLSNDLVHETYHFLKRHFASFDGKLKQRIFDHIRKSKIKDYDGVVSDRLTASYRMRWLSVIIGSGLKEADDLYQSLKNKYGYEHENPDFLMYLGVTQFGETSPLQVSELLEMQLNQIVKYLEGYTKNDEWEGPTVAGLAESLEKAVSEKPNKFTANIKEFEDLYPIYWRAIIAGIDNYCSAKSDPKQVDWDQVFCFLEEKFDKYSDWYPIEKEIGRGVYDAWYNAGFIHSSMRLIRKLSNLESFDVVKTYRNEIYKIIKKALSFVETKVDFANRNFVNTSINSTRGYVFDALLHFLIRCTKEKKKDKHITDVDWESFKNVFDCELNKSKNDNIEFTVMVASHLPNIAYLSSDWLMQNILKLFDANNELNFLAAVEAYTYSGHNNGPIEERLWGNGIFDQALEKYKEGRVRKKLIERLTLGYIQGTQKINDSSTFNQLIKQMDGNDISVIIRYIWSANEFLKDNEDCVKRIIKLWDKLINGITKQSQEHKGIMSDLNLFIVYCKTLEKPMVGRLLKTVEYINLNHNSYYFIEEMLKHVGGNPEEVASLFTKMLDGYFPQSPKESIVKILKVLEHKSPINAYQINALYIEKYGWDILSEIDG